MINVIFDILQTKNGNTPGVRRSVQKRQDMLTNQEKSILDMIGNYDLKQKYENIPRKCRPDIVKIYNEYMNSENMNNEIVFDIIEKEIRKYKDENKESINKTTSTKPKRKFSKNFHENKRKRDELTDKMGKLSINKEIKKTKNADRIIDMFEKISMKK